MNPPLAILFANLKGNIGDFAILHAMLADLQRRFPANSIHVFPHASLPIDEARWQAFRASELLSFEMGGAVFSRRIPRSLRLFANAGLWPAMRSAYENRLIRQAEPGASRFAGYDAVFIAGGHQWSGYMGLSMFATLNAIHRYNSNIYGYPFTVTPRAAMISKRGALARNFRQIRQPLVVRDPLSKSFLDELSLDSVLGADCVYSLRAMAQKIPTRPGRDRSRILLAMTGKRRRLRRQLGSLIARLRQDCPKLTLLTTCEAEDGALFAQVAHTFGIEYLAPLTWQEAVAEMKSSSLVISNRLHGLIFGSFAAVPLLPVADRAKARAFSLDADLPHIVKSLDDISPDKLRKVRDDEAVIVSRLNSFHGLCEGRLTAPVTSPTQGHS